MQASNSDREVICRNGLSFCHSKPEITRENGRVPKRWTWMHSIVGSVVNFRALFVLLCSAEFVIKCNHKFLWVFLNMLKSCNVVSKPLFLYLFNNKSNTFPTMSWNNSVACLINIQKTSICINYACSIISIVFYFLWCISSYGCPFLLWVPDPHPDPNT
jgi:hypothetical protein